VASRTARSRTPSGAPTAICARLGGDDRRPPLGCERSDQRFQALGAGAVQAGEGLIEQQDLRVLNEAACDQDALALPAGELAESLSGKRVEPDFAQCIHRGLALAPPRPTPPGQPRERPHRRYVEGRDRIVELRALGLWDGGAASPDAEGPGERGQLAQQGAQQGRLAAPVRAEQRHPLSRLQREGDAGDRRLAVVAGGESGGLDQSFTIHPRSPPVNPRTSSSAFASSIPT
jgi:hypothetical protein